MRHLPSLLYLAVLVAASALVSSGCMMTSAKSGVDFSLDDVKQIRTGVTTKSDIRAKFGEPQRRDISPYDGKEVWAYAFSAISVGLSNKTYQKAFSVTFNKDVVDGCLVNSSNIASSIGTTGSTQSFSLPCDRL
jgi:hypothetical protein